MASNFMFVDNPQFELPPLKYEPMKTYGFKKVTKDQLDSILERLQRRTFNAELYFGERFQRIPSPPRPPSTVCKRLAADRIRKEEEVHPQGPSTSNRRSRVALNTEELEQLLHRLRTPTASILANSESNAKREALTPHSGGRARVAISATEKEREALEQLSRPTTASRDKRVLRYASDPVILSYNQKSAERRSEERPLSRQEQSELVQRVQADTVASRGGGLPFCRRMPSAWKQRLASTADAVCTDS